MTFESDEVRDTGGTAIEGVTYTYPINDPANEEAYQQFAAEYKSRFGVAPNNPAAMAYDSAIILDQAFTKCGTENRQCLLDYIAALGKYQGMGGVLYITKNRLPIRPFGIKEYSGGEFRWVTKDLVADE